MKTQNTNLHGHGHRHQWCIASVVYNSIVILIELLIFGFLNHMELDKLVKYESRVQLFHLVGMITLGVLNYLWIHRYHYIKIRGFISITSIMLLSHITLLHILPRVLGIGINYDNNNNIIEVQEYLILFIIVFFVTLAFVFRDKILVLLKLKNRWKINLF